MDYQLRALSVIRDGGVFTAAEAARIGLTNAELNRRHHADSVQRLARGTYIDAATWRAGTPAEHHVSMAQACALTLEAPLSGSVALSHTAAAAWWKLPLVQIPRTVHLSRLHPGRGYTRRRYVIHQTYGIVPGDQQAHGRRPNSRPRIPVLSPASAALGVAEVQGFVPGVVALDNALHRELTSVAEVNEWLAAVRPRPGVATMRRVAAAANGLAESPLESQARLIVQSLGYAPSLQVTLRTSDGSCVARVDMLLEESGVVLEVDGRVKYAQGASPEVLISEKRRESAIVDLGYAVMRLERHHFDDIQAIDTRIRTAARRAQPWRPRLG